MTKKTAAPVEVAKIGDRALYYDSRIAESPFAAIVTSVVNDSEVRLAVFNPNGTLMSPPLDKVRAYAELPGDDVTQPYCVIQK